MKNIIDKQIELIVRKFSLKGKFKDLQEIKAGHINYTAMLRTVDNGKIHKYILQSINTNLFKDYRSLMKNIVLVSNHIKIKMKKRYKRDYKKKVLRFKTTKTGKSYLKVDNYVF